MKKAELEKEIIELKARIIALESRQQIVFCGCSRVCNLPHYPSYPPSTITYGGAGPGFTNTFGSIS
jgi:hypothetical protein